jgi:hypothetical protein
VASRNTTARGYGARHQTERRKWDALLKSEPARCACTRADCPHHDDQCPTVITNETAWDLGHNDDRTAWTGPECVPCNRSAGGRNGNATQRTQRETTIREW